ncbi:MAG: HNH endonuclease signature motif containing protein [Planctomycetota bacterium]|nr:HNH endonuclease signature motif containing protein [Planctomycetota bacterium]
MNPAYPFVAERARHRCEYCLAPETMFNCEFEVEHILPRSQDGSSQTDNLALSCRACNKNKSDRVEEIDDMSQERTRLFHPRRDKWTLHFAISADGSILGLTAIGRVTVFRLKFNSRFQLAARQCWIKLGLFP